MERFTRKTPDPCISHPVRYCVSVVDIRNARTAISGIQLQAVTIDFVKLPDYLLAPAHAELVGAFPYQFKRKVEGIDAARGFDFQRQGLKPCA